MTSTSHAQRSASLELEDHASFLRSLARRLVKDASSADDLAQETLMAAVTSKTRRGGLDSPEARPWMARVLRRKAANQWRTDSRRSAREDAAAQQEATGSTFDSVAQIDLAERLLGHVRGLDPAVQDAIMARFYRGMALKDAAQEAGVPVTTMQSRISRGLGEMRAKLDAEEPGGRSAWLSALAAFGGLGEGAKVAAASAAAVGSRMGAWWIAGAVAGTATLVGAVVLWMAPVGMRSDLQAAEPAAQGVATGGSATASSNLSRTGSSQDTDLAKVASTADAADARVELPVASAGVDAPTTDEWTGVVYYLDDKGAEQPAAAAQVEWSSKAPGSVSTMLGEMGYAEDSLQPARPAELGTGPAGPTKNTTITDASGRFQIQAIPGDHDLTVRVAEDPQFRLATWSGTGADWAGTEEPIALTHIPHGALTGKVLNYEGEPMTDVSIALSADDAGVKYEVVTDSEGAFELPHFAVRQARSILREAIRLPGHVVVGHEEPRRLEQGGWQPLTVVLARTGTVRVTLPKSPLASREVVLSVDPTDPLQVRPHFRRFKLEATVAADGVALIQGAPIGPALNIRVAKSYFSYDYEAQGIAQSSGHREDKNVPSAWSRIRIPASGTLDLELPSRTGPSLNVAVVRTDGTPAEGASVMAFAKPRTGEAMDMMLFRGKSDADGKAHVQLPSLNSPQPILIVANDDTRASFARGHREAPFGSAFWDPAADPTEEIVLETRPVTRARGRIVLPGRPGSSDASETDVHVTILAPSSVNETPFPLLRQDFSSRNIDAKGEFEFMTMLGCRYRIDAQHEGFEDVSFEVELDAASPPVEIRFQAPINLAELTVRLDVEGEDDAWRMLIYGPSPDDAQSLKLNTGTSAKTIHVPPGKLWLRASGGRPGAKLQSPDSGYHIVPKGASEIILHLRPKVIASGSLLNAANERGVVFLQLIPEGRSEPLYVGMADLNRPTPWIETDPQGRFRCECPTGSYTAWIGTRRELEAKQPRRRVPFTVTTDGLNPAKL